MYNKKLYVLECGCLLFKCCKYIITGLVTVQIVRIVYIKR